MLESIFGNRTAEKVLFYLLQNETCYGAELSRTFSTALSPIQKCLDRLENGEIIVSHLVGKTRLYQFNPRYPFLEELKQLLTKAYKFLSPTIKEKCYEPKVRKRPRKKGKPL